MGGFITNVRPVQDGEQVRGGVANRAPMAAFDNTQYLKRRLDMMEAGEAIIAFDRTIKSDVMEGMPVFWNASKQQYEKAIAGVDTDAETDLLVTTAATQVAGILLTKTNNFTGDILLRGIAEVDLSAAIDGDVTTGIHYLSNVATGKLTPTRPPVPVAVLNVLQATTGGLHEVIVATQFTDFLESHRHYKVALVAEPAGTHSPPSPGGTHTITAADSDLEGWLPADDAVFNGTAPAGAKFGYNLSVGKLGTLWPPIPAETSVLEWYKPTIGDYTANRVAGRVPTELLTINADGIWWMSDCYDEVPWPTDYDSSDPVSLSTSVCPTEKAVELVFWFLKPTFFSATTAVLSLRAREGSGLAIYCRNTDEERGVGHLDIDFNLALLVDSTTEEGHIVFKEFDEETNTLLRGPVVGSIRSASPELVVTSSADLLSSGRAVGDVVLTADLDFDGQNVLVHTVRLDGVTQEYYKDVMSLGFSASKTSAYRGALKINDRLSLPDGTQLKLRFYVLGRAAGSFPAGMFTLSYRRFSKPTAVLTNTVTLPTSDTSLAMTCTATLVGSDNYVLMESAAFDIATGDQIQFTITREAPDAYAAEVHVLFQEGVLVLS